MEMEADCSQAMGQPKSSTTLASRSWKDTAGQPDTPNGKQSFRINSYLVA
jgi:hypothetical protein